MFASYDNENYLAAFTSGGVGFGFDVHTVKGGISRSSRDTDLQRLQHPMPGLVPGILLRCHRPAQACHTACINSQTSDSRNSFAAISPFTASCM
jgi:hypothetical protein